jgi:lipopolysaccharide transport system ATP-binding protein
MSQPMISADKLSKAYRLGPPERRHDTLTGMLQSALLKPWRDLRRLRRLDTFSHLDAHAQSSNTPDIVWALRDVSFDVAEGEVVGIIGRNGAGKSTLLKVLSRITETTAGRAEIRGRVSSLLEVGTGFHPELSGRDNIYMNGTILGMTKREIDRKFDAIVDFSGVEKFVDTPVKRYSSGMQVRLAFAVAAHLEPEILIVDEVLAVGDAEFQKKCVGKMQSVATSGRTVLFVSHNMAAVQGLCTQAMVLSEGRLQYSGSVAEATEVYARSSAHERHHQRADLSQRRNLYLPGQTIIRAVSLHDDCGRPSDTFWTSRPLHIRIELEGFEEQPGAQVGVIFKTMGDQWIMNFNTGMKPPITRESARRQVATLQIPQLPLVPGQYWIDVSVAQKSSGRLDYVSHAVLLSVESYDVYGSGYTVGRGEGFVYLDAAWDVAADNHGVTTFGCN